MVARHLADRVQRQRGQWNGGPFINAVCAWATAEQVPLLLAILDEDSWGRPAVLDALGRIQDARAIPAVVRLLRNLDTRDHAVRVLRQIGPAAEKETLPLLETNDVFLRQSIIALLRYIGTPASIPALQRIATNRDALLHRAPAQQAIRAIEARAAEQPAKG
jgi:HEAT repeat protein